MNTYDIMFIHYTYAEIQAKNKKEAIKILEKEYEDKGDIEIISVKKYIKGHIK